MEVFSYVQCTACTKHKISMNTVTVHTAISCVLIKRLNLFFKPFLSYFLGNRGHRPLHLHPVRQDVSHGATGLVKLDMEVVGVNLRTVCDFKYRFKANAFLPCIKRNTFTMTKLKLKKKDDIAMEITFFFFFGFCSGFLHCGQV